MSDAKFMSKQYNKPTQNMNQKETEAYSSGQKKGIIAGISMIPIGRGIQAVGSVISKAPALARAIKAFTSAPKQYFKLAGKPFETNYRNITSGINQLKSKPTSNFRPLVTGNKVYDKKMINDAFAKRFGSAKPKATPANPKNVIRNHVAKKPEKDALTHPYFNRSRK